MLLATRRLWVTSGILWSCCTWIQFLLFFLLFCLVELSGNCWSQNNSICREGCFGVGTYIVNYIILLTALLSIPSTLCLQGGSCFPQSPWQSVLEEKLLASLMEQHFGDESCLGMLSQGLSRRAARSGRASPKDNLLEGPALPAFVIQRRLPHIPGASSWAWAIVLSARLSISP